MLYNIIYAVTNKYIQDMDQFDVSLNNSIEYWMPLYHRYPTILSACNELMSNLSFTLWVLLLQNVTTTTKIGKNNLISICRVELCETRMKKILTFTLAAKCFVSRFFVRHQYFAVCLFFFLLCSRSLSGICNALICRRSSAEKDTQRGWVRWCFKWESFNVSFDYMNG